MKNKKINIALFVFLAFGMASLALAQTSTTSSPKTEGQKSAREQLEQIKEKAQAEVEQKVASVASQITANRYARVSNRYNATISRLENIIARMETRIAKIKAEGGNTETAEKAVADAKKNIADAKTSMTSLSNAAILADQAYKNATTTKQIRTIFLDYHKVSSTTQKLLKQAHTSLIRSIGILKGLKVGQASTTPSTN